MKKINSEITKINPCKLKIKITIDKPEVEEVYNSCCVELQKEAQVPGFRKGTIPIDLVKKFFPQQLQNLFVQKIIDNTLPEVLKEHKINYIPDSLQITSTDIQPDNISSYEVVLETEPEVKLKSYKGLKLKKEIRKVTQEHIDKTINQIKEENARLLPSLKIKIEPNDISETSNIFCIINFKIFIDGKELKKYEGKNVLIPLADNNLPKGLKEGLVGMQVGEKRNLMVEFPVNIPQTELMGKNATMEVELVELKEKKLPNLDDEFAKDLGYKNVDELISHIRQYLQQEFENESKQKLRNQIYEILIKEHNFAIPETEVERHYQEIIESLKRDFLARNKQSEFKLTEEQTKLLRKKAEDEIKLKYILKKIITEEKIEVTEEQLEKEKEKLLKLYPGREKEVSEYFETNKNIIASNILEDKIFDLIISNAKVKEEIV